MIQSDITESFNISRLGDLRAWLAANAHLPDDTEINVEGIENGDEEPLITLAKRTWDKHEQGRMVVYKDGVAHDVEQTLIVIREWSSEQI